VVVPHNPLAGGPKAPSRGAVVRVMNSSASTRKSLDGRRLAPLGLAATTPRRRLLLGAMAHAPFEPVGPVRGLPAPVVNDANNLTHASAGARFYGGAPREDRLFRPGAAALAQGLGKGRRQRPFR
jgi:hypothetical protein